MTVMKHLYSEMGTVMCEITLNDLVQAEIQRISELEEGEEKNQAIENLGKLYRMKNEDEKIQSDLKKKDHDWVDIALRIGLTVFQVGAPLIFYAGFLKSGFKFEETGAYSSFTFRNLLNRMPK